MKLNENDLETIKKYKIETKQRIMSLGIDLNRIYDYVIDSWNQIFTISDEKKDIVLGENLFPKPQMMGYFLEVLISKKFKNDNGDEWVFDPTGYAKDITNTLDDEKSIEIKTSSNPKHIYGNRSYATIGSKSKKSKQSFYLAVNFEPFNNNKLDIPNVRLIRFGYLEQSDWKPQKSATGQQATINPISEKGKLLELWPNMDEILK